MERNFGTHSQFVERHGRSYLEDERTGRSMQDLATFGMSAVGFPLAFKGIGAALKGSVAAAKFTGKMGLKSIAGVGRFTGRLARKGWSNVPFEYKGAIIGGGAAGLQAGVYAGRAVGRRREKQRGLPADNLGATGDLTLGLHHGK